MTCEHCTHWQPRDRAHDARAACAAGYGKTAFDDTCRAFTPLELAAPDQQSACRGMTVQEWQQRLTGKRT